jgi:anti-sigma regulatory factor (Ser/Thr protein kinase)
MNDRPDQHLSPISDLLLPTAGSARHARDLITGACMQWELPHLVEPASLIVTELVTNAVRHAGTLIDLQIINNDGQLLILVSDGSTAVPAPPSRAATTARLDPDRAIGLILVDATADRWGCRRITGGKTMWSALIIGAQAA